MIKLATKIRFYNFGSFRLDILNSELLKNGEHIALTQKSFDILQFLIENRSKILKKEEILKAIWTESFVEEANLAQHIYMIRKVLKGNGDTVNYIETIPKYGYRFIGEVTENSEETLTTDKKLLIENSFQSNLKGNDKGLSKNVDGNSSEKQIESKISPSPQTSKKHSLMIPNIIFATLLFAIISTFIYLTYFSVPAKQTDISNIKSISILPFRQIGGSKDEKIELGLADTLISRLSNQNQIAFSPTTTIEKISYTDSSNSIEIGEKLNVDAVLTGTVQKEGELVRINVQLISVQTKVPLWTDKFDVEFSNVFSLQDIVSEKLATKLSIKLKTNTQFALKTSFIPKSEANEDFKKGLEHWNKRTSSDFSMAIEYFENAVNKDENFAEAYAYLADTYSLIGYYKLEKVMPTKVAIEKAILTANKALRLNSNLSEAYMSLALVAVFNNKNSEAQKLYKKAIRLKPDNATAHLRLAWTLTTEESLDDAINEMRLAQKAKPQSQIINTSLARLLRLNRQTDEALDYVKKAIEIDPTKTVARVVLAEIYEQKGQLDKSIKELQSVTQNAPEEKTAKLLLSRVYAKKGKKKEAREMLKDAGNVKGKTPMPTYEVATVYAHLGEKKEAVKKLQKSKDDSLIYFLHLKYDYNIDPLRNTPEYSKLLSQSKNKIDKNKDKES